MAYSRQWLVDLLRKNGYQREAEQALRALPDEIDRAQLVEFGNAHNIFVDELVDRMGGSP